MSPGYSGEIKAKPGDMIEALVEDRDRAAVRVVQKEYHITKVTIDYRPWTWYREKLEEDLKKIFQEREDAFTRLEMGWSSKTSKDHTTTGNTGHLKKSYTG